MVPSPKKMPMWLQMNVDMTTVRSDEQFITIVAIDVFRAAIITDRP